MMMGIPGIVQDSYVICKVFQMEGLGPRNGRPFNEEDWSHDDDDDDDFAQSAPLTPSSDPTSSCQTGWVPSPGDTVYSSCETGFTDPASSYQMGSMPPSPDSANQAVTNDDDILSMLDIFIDTASAAEGALLTDFFYGLGDLDCSALGSFGHNAEFNTNGMATVGCDCDCDCDDDFIELSDLDDSELFCQS